MGAGCTSHLGRPERSAGSAGVSARQKGGEGLAHLAAGPGRVP